MLKGAFTFMILGLVAILLGAKGVGGLTVDIGKILLLIFVILACVSFIAKAIYGNRFLK